MQFTHPYSNKRRSKRPAPFKKEEFENRRHISGEYLCVFLAYITLCIQKKSMAASKSYLTFGAESAIVLLFLIMACTGYASAQKSGPGEAGAIKAIGDGIGTSLDDFCKSTRATGFSPAKLAEDDGLTLATLSGKVGKLGKCKVVTAASKETGMRIRHAMVFMHRRDSWKELESDYAKLKGLLTTIYGKPEDSSESFLDEEPQDDGGKVDLLKKDKADFTTTYAKGSLSVMLSITYTAEHGAHVGILFIDKRVSSAILGPLGGR